MHIRTSRNDPPVPSHPVAPLSRGEYNRQHKAWKEHCKALRVEEKARKRRDKDIARMRKINLDKQKQS